MPGSGSEQRSQRIRVLRGPGMGRGHGRCVGTLAAMLKLERRQQEVAGAEDLADNNRQRNNRSGSSVFARAQYHVGWSAKGGLLTTTQQ